MILNATEACRCAQAPVHVRLTLLREKWYSSLVYNHGKIYYNNFICGVVRDCLGSLPGATVRIGNILRRSVLVAVFNINNHLPDFVFLSKSWTQYLFGHVCLLSASVKRWDWSRGKAVKKVYVIVADQIMIVRGSRIKPVKNIFVSRAMIMKSPRSWRHYDQGGIGVRPQTINTCVMRACR